MYWDRKDLNDVHGRVAKGLGILLYFSKPGRVAAYQVQLCILVLNGSRSAHPSLDLQASGGPVERYMLDSKATVVEFTAKAAAMALPDPEEAPVIRADLPCRSFCPLPAIFFCHPAPLTDLRQWNITAGGCSGLCGISAPDGTCSPCVILARVTSSESYLCEEMCP